MRESKIEEDLCIWAKSQGIIVIKIATRGGAQRGVWQHNHGWPMGHVNAEPPEEK